MNVLDENFPSDQRRQLVQLGIHVRQIGDDIGVAGASDANIITLLQSIPQPTFFTQDQDFFKRRLCHRRYCLIWLDLHNDTLAFYVRAILKHQRVRNWRLRAGTVIRAHSAGLEIWRLNGAACEQRDW